MGSNNKPNSTASKKEDWMNAKWRPAMGWMYMGVCIADFVIFPILWTIIQAIDKDGAVTSQWQPLTLQGAGLFHIAMGAVLGITAYGRTKEKLFGVENDNTNYRPEYARPMPPSPRAYDTGYSNQPPMVPPPRVPMPPVRRPPDEI